MNDTVVSIDGKKINTWIEINEIVMKNPDKELIFRVKRNDEAIEIKVTPEPEKIKDEKGNEILIGRIGISKVSSTVGGVVEGSPAEKAGLKRNDAIVAIDGTPVNNWDEMAGILSKNPGKELTLKIKRNNETVDINITPNPVKIKDKEGNEIMVGRIGIEGKSPYSLIKSNSLFDVPLKALKAVYEWCVLTLVIVVKLFTGGMSANQVGGPILIVGAAAKAASIGAFTYFNLIAIISINLAILNLLPVPVLDGGHVMFFSIEALRGKPLSDKFLLMANKVGMVLLLALIVFVFYNDIDKFIVPWVQENLLSK